MLVADTAGMHQILIETGQLTNEDAVEMRSLDPKNKYTPVIVTTQTLIDKIDSMSSKLDRIEFRVQQLEDNSIILK